MSLQPTVKEELYLVCPDCHMEQIVRQELSSDALFLTALGTVFQIDAFEYAEDVNLFLSGEDIMTINIVNSVHCTFIQNVIKGIVREDIVAEKVLNNLLDSMKSQEDSERLSEYQMAKGVANRNIQRQAVDLTTTAFIGSKITKGQIKLKGWLYDREKDSFKETPIFI